MPYINQEERHQLAVELPPNLSTGQMNFIVSDLFDQWIGMVPNYDRLNSAIGVLECCLQEIYRRLVVPYEDKQITKSGDVFMERE